MGCYANHPDGIILIRGNRVTMRLLTETEIEAFIAAKPAAAIHFDAEWDTNYRTIIRRKMEEAEQALGEQVNFGEVDCDLAPELAKSVPVLNAMQSRDGIARPVQVDSHYYMFRESRPRPKWTQPTSASGRMPAKPLPGS